MPWLTCVTPMTSYSLRRARLVSAFGAIYLLWGSNYLAIRYAVEAMPPVLMMAARSLIGVALIVTAAPTGEKRAARDRPGEVLVDERA